LAIVEELAARLRHRHTLYYSQDDYDGILHAVETERVGLASDDVSLMWKVFDYASMSASKGRNEAATAGDKIDRVPGIHSATHIEQPQNRSENLKANQSGAFIPDGDLNSFPSTSLETHNFQGNETLMEAPNLALFDQLPEDWAFTIDDWTLFGAPGSTYFYNEGP